MAAASSGHIGGSLDFRLCCLTFADEGYVADPLLYCTSYLVSPVVDYHMRYKGEKYQNGGNQS